MIRTVLVNSRDYLFSPDDPIPLGGRVQAIVKLRVTDELTGTAPDSRITIQTEQKHFIPRVSGDGIAGLVGVPQQVFSRLKTDAYKVNLTVSADGYLPRNVSFDFPPDPNFPDTFTPPLPLTISLHRAPTVIFGRTMRANGGTLTPVAGATVSVKGIWRTPPASSTSPPFDAPHLVALSAPLYSDRPALTQFIQQRDLIAGAAPDKTLIEDLLPGANPILLSDRQGIAAGDVLLIDANEPDLVEFIVIKTVPVTSPPDQQTLITLEYPVSNAHRRNAVVQQMAPQAPGLQHQFTVAGDVGDTCVLLDGVSALTAAREVQITGGPEPDEFHKLMRFSVLSDAAGYYRLPPLNRVAQVQILSEIVIGPQTFQTDIPFRPDFRQRENRLDLTLKV